MAPERLGIAAAQLTAAGGLGQAAECIGIDAEAAILRSRGVHEPDRPARRLLAIGRLGHTHQVGALPVGANGAGVLTRPDLLELSLDRLEIRRDEAQHGAIEVARRAVLVDRGDRHTELAVVGRREADVDALRVLRRQRPAHDLAQQRAERLGADPFTGPLLAGVRCPRHGTTQPVLPLCQERVLACGEQRDRGSSLRGRGVVAVELRQAPGVEPAQDLGGLRRNRLEALLHDLLAGGPDRLAQEDVGDARGVRGVVVAPAGLLRELAQDVG